MAQRVEQQDEGEGSRGPGHCDPPQSGHGGNSKRLENTTKEDEENPKSMGYTMSCK